MNMERRDLEEHDLSFFDRPDEHWDGDLVPGFVPNRDELLEIVKYWYNRILDIQWMYTMLQQAGRMDLDREDLADRRISRIEHALGKEAVDAVIEKVEEEFREHLDPETWRIFREGSEEQRGEYAEKFYADLDSERALLEAALKRFGTEHPAGLAETALRHISYRFDRKQFSERLHEMLNDWKSRGKTLRSIHLCDEGERKGLQEREAAEYARRVAEGEDSLEVLANITLRSKKCSRCGRDFAQQ